MDTKSYNVLKLEKLSRAVYLVTEYMSDREPLKWELRQLALDSLYELKENEKSAQYSGLISLLGKIVALIDLVLATSSGSTMNFTLLKKEYLNLLDSLESESLKSLNNGLRVEVLLPAAQTIVPNNPIESNTSAPIKSFNLSNTDLLDKTQRQKQILDYLKGKGWLSIKDIADTLPNFSSKTVQRELLELVDKGLLKKKGERRWSRYSLI